MAATGAASGCSRDIASVEALRVADPHLGHFLAFERWARRAISAGGALGAPAVFGETLFAPIQLDRAVVEAWVVHRRAQPRVWSMRRGGLPGAESAWVRVRHESAGQLDVLETRLHDTRDRSPAHVPCVLLSREGAGPAMARAQVIVAYLNDLDVMEGAP